MPSDLTAVESRIASCDALLVEMGMKLDEASGEYYYELENVKRVVLDGDPCDLCEDEFDEGWIPDDEAFPNSGEDGPPFHPNCKCDLEYKEKRVRVYV